jgi:hypothetical protein
MKAALGVRFLAGFLAVFLAAMGVSHTSSRGVGNRKDAFFRGNSEGDFTHLPMNAPREKC